MANISYELADGQPTDGPKAKVPWIDDAGHVLGDSSFIIGYLKQNYGDPLDGHLTAGQAALGHAVQRMMEDSLYFVSSYSKWVEDEGFKIYAAELFAGMPAEQLEYVPDMVRKKVMDKLYAQGICRHNAEEVYAIGQKDVASFSELLGDQQYILGDTPTSFDASAFGVIGNLKDGPFPSSVRDAICNAENVVNYVDRIRNNVFSDIQ